MYNGKRPAQLGITEEQLKALKNEILPFAYYVVLDNSAEQEYKFMGIPLVIVDVVEESEGR
jgi:hypothetical protein